MKKRKPLPKAPSLADDIETRQPKRTARQRQARGPVPEDPAVAAAAKSREDAYAAVYQWNGVTLRPFSISRESIFYKLRAADDAPRLSQVLQNASAFLGDALRILYLCSHEPEAFEHLRSDSLAFLRAIERWADSNVTRDQATEATRIGLKIFNDSKVNLAEPAPSDRTDLGE